MSNCLCGIVLVGTCVLSAMAGGEVTCPDSPELRIAGAELQRYWCAIVGDGEMPPVRLRVDKSVSKSGNDAYAIKSVGDGAVIVGSNGRSVLYGVYDLLERRGGCGWFWDGDRVPKREKIDLTGLDVREESKFEYRGLRYFAHRGLMRFQAEHWGPEEWRREIDWCLKKRLNLLMLRIGQDDVFQKAFPDAAKYPDPSKPLPGALKGYDNRTLFWPLQYRGKLRKEVMDYAFARGMMAPEDFGTMTHWYSRTPQDFLETMKPEFFPQKGGAYSEPSGLIFDIRQKKYRDWYWKLTETSIREYGRPDLLHTIGVAERRVSDDPKANRQTKIDFTRLIMDEAHGRCPDAKILLAGWDFYATWQKEEVPEFLKKLDPARTIVWDYEADAYSKTNFTEWGVIGKFPYTFGIFMAYEAGLDMRTDYDRIVARQKLIENDPTCKGYILWPESSHVDSIGLEWFAKNSWRADRAPVEPVVADYCGRRYPDEAEAMRELWMKTLPVSTNMQHVWRWNAFLPVLRDMGEGLIKPEGRKNWPDPKEDAVFADLPDVVSALKALDWEKDGMLRRDMTDLARVWADRLAVEAENRMIAAYYRWMDGDDASAEAVVRNGTLAIARLNALAELLALHEDFSVCDTYDRVNAIHPIAYPRFISVLVDNAANSYCASHQAELARHCYIPAFERYLEMLKEKLRKGDRTPFARFCLEDFRARAMDLDRESLRLKVPRTRAAFNRALDRILAAAGPAARETVGRDRLGLKDRDGELWWRDRHAAKLDEIARRSKDYDLVMIGDSITDFWETRPSNGWECVTNRWKTLNLGFRGDRVQNVIWRLEHGELDGFTAKTVAILIGTNNHAWRMEESEPEATAAAVEQIIYRVRERQPDARIVLFGIFPRGTSSKDAHLVEAQRRNVEANGLLERVATQTAVEWVDLADRYLDPATGFCRPELFRDGTHPSRAGYEIWFEALKRVMNQPPMTPPPALMTSSDWDVRRAEMLKTLTEEEYGVRPVERPANLRFAPIDADREALGGKAIRRRVRISYVGPGGEGHFDALAFMPKNREKTPVFVQILLGQTAEKIGFDPNTFEGCSRCPLAKIIDRGYALVLFVNWEVAMDDPATCFQTGVFRCWPPTGGVRGPKDWGAISAWAWGASRVMDWIETVPELDAKRVAVIGHSRGGKTALWAGATDPRFAYVISNDSGCSGARISHMDLPGAETVARITTRFPHWFCVDYRQWGGRQREIPFDQHWLLALIAPRPLAVGSATLDAWAGPTGEFESACLAAPAWERFGKRGLVADAFPPPETPLSDGSVSYHLRTGRHDLTEADWSVYLDFADRNGWGEDGNVIRVEAPFGKYEIRLPQFGRKDFPVVDFGAKADGTKCTEAFAAAMAACERAGGGRVVVPKGTWLTGAVRFGNNCNLHLEEDATLEFTDDPADYPEVHTTWEGIECYNHSPLLYAYGVTNVAITGKGTIAPRMDFWRTWFARPPEHMKATEHLYYWCSTNAPMEARRLLALDRAHMRPQLIQFNRCGNILLDGFKIRESPFWMIHLYHSENCVVRNLDTYARGHNNDGVDVDMTKNVLIENCRFDQGDDGVCLKAGRNADAWRLDRCTENVVVRDCDMVNCHSLLGIGSELSGGVRNVWMTRCTVQDTYSMLRIKTGPRRGGFVENVWMDHCRGTRMIRAFNIFTQYCAQWGAFPDFELRRTRIRNVNLSDCEAVLAAKGLELKGDPRLPPRGIRVRNLKIAHVVDRLTDIGDCLDVRIDGLALDESLASKPPARLIFAGDSTLDDNGLSRGGKARDPYRSWGTTLRDSMRDGCGVLNFAKSGASTKSFMASGEWMKVKRAIRPGDFVAIQFGHNDQKRSNDFYLRERWADPKGLFRENVRRMVADVREMGGVPLLLSPICRGTFDPSGKRLVDTAHASDGVCLGSYRDAMAELSKELGCDYVDMNGLTRDLMERIGKEESMKFFVISTGYRNGKDGEPSKDTTHPCKAGAEAFARVFMAEIKTRGLSVGELFL